MSALAPLLDKLSSTPFDKMTPLVVREQLKELAGMQANDAVIANECALLTTPQQDALMKVIYVGLATDPKQSAAWFKWHAALHKVSGPGAIIRTLTDVSPLPVEAVAASA